MPVMTVGTGRALVGGGGTYNDLVMGTGPIAYWPQSETAGVTAHCLVNPLQDGTYTGVTLANDNAGPFGTPAPFYDGATSYLNVLTAALIAAINGSEGSAMIWAKVANVGVWTDTVLRMFLMLSTNTGTSYVHFLKHSNANQQRRFYNAGAVAEAYYDSLYSPITWQQVVMAWSATADEVKYYLNGAWQETDTVLGVWGGALNGAFIGALNAVPGNPYHGWLGPAGIWTRALPPAEVAGLYV